MTDLSVIPRGSVRVSGILNKINSKANNEENIESKPQNEINKLKKSSEISEYESNQIINSNINPKEIMHKINTNLLNNPNAKVRDSLLIKSNFNAIVKNEEINFRNPKDNYVGNKEIEKISDDSMIQDFKNLLKFKKKTSDPFDMEYDLNYIYITKVYTVYLYL